MAEQIITGTLVVGFSRPDTSANAGQIIIERDDRPDGLNEGRSQDYPGDAVHYLVYLPPNASIIEHTSSVGSSKISGAGSGNRIVDDDEIEFAYSREGSLRYYTPSFNYDWIGNSLGNAALQSDNRTVRIAKDDGVGILRANYSAPYKAFKLSGVPLDVFKVVIGIKAQVTL